MDADVDSWPAATSRLIIIAINVISSSSSSFSDGRQRLQRSTPANEALADICGFVNPFTRRHFNVAHSHVTMTRTFSRVQSGTFLLHGSNSSLDFTINRFL